MNPTSKKLIVLSLMGMLAFSVLFTPVCSTMCAVTLNVAGEIGSTSCNISSHFLVQSGVGPSDHFILILIGLFFFIGVYFIPDGFVLSPYRPPRFHA
ncbi:MAG: hypothetical protein LJE66_01900 [Desulfobacterales bacterium]|nr:hypothetical protein [Desulfobacterales bacterium]